MFLYALASLLYLRLVPAFRPLQGQQILGNTTYQVQWNISAYGSNTQQEWEGVYFKVPKLIPYTSTLSTESPNFLTMTTTGYVNMIFTEVNPTSTTTAILLVHNKIGHSFTAGLYTVIQHDHASSTPTVSFYGMPSRTVTATRTTDLIEAVTSSLSSSVFSSLSSSRSSFVSTLSSTQTQPTSTSAHKNTPQPRSQNLSIGDLTAIISTVVGILTVINGHYILDKDWKPKSAGQ